MTDPIAAQRAQAARLGPSAALRAQPASGSRERLIARPGRRQACSSEWDELERRQRELDGLEHGSR